MTKERPVAKRDTLSLIGIDFGTTNSVVAVMQPDGSVRTARFAVGAAELDVFRTVLCFWRQDTAGRSTLRHAAGPHAVEAYLDDPLDTRLIMSMKTYRAQRSFTQTQVYAGRIRSSAWSRCSWARCSMGRTWPAPASSPAARSALRAT